MAGRIIRGSSSELPISKSIETGKRYKTDKGYSSIKPLVFISHRQSDSPTAGAIANLLIASGDIDVYLEAFDPNLSMTGNSNKIVEIIDFGLNICTHLLAIVSDNTRGSWWVPYEVGIAKNRPIPCGLLLLSVVKDLPEYLKTSEIIKDTHNMLLWVKEIPGVYTHKSFSINETVIPNLPQFRQSNVSFYD